MIHLLAPVLLPWSAACTQEAARPAELAFSVRERGGAPIPARLTFVPAAGAPGLRASGDAAALELAVRDDVLYAKNGAGRVTLAPGHYRVSASHGPEWSLDSQELELGPGETRTLDFELVHELDTPGWIGADFHLHTATYSGHGDANVAERLLACLGEGLELAVATDHDHHTDYGPTLAELGLAGRLALLTGDEITTPLGHFNAFPLDPARAPVSHQVENGVAELFARVRAETNPLGMTPLIQVNHPRLEGLDYFTQVGLDPVTGTSADPRYAGEFDALEVLNGNEALGYLDPVVARRAPNGHPHSALVDWFHLLDLGARCAALGNSDSHDVRASISGYPRNYVRSSSDDPAHVKLGELCAAVRAKQVFTTTGPFLECSIGDVGLGGTARASDGHATLHVRVRAASWVDCDRVLVYVNGARVATRPARDVRTPLRFEEDLELCLRDECARHARTGASGPPFDAWVVVVAEGDDALAPVLAGSARPLAIANPIWIDGDGDGRWESPRARVEAALRTQRTPELAKGWFAHLRPEEQALALAVVARGPFASVMIDAGLAAGERDVLLAAVRACERVARGIAMPGVQRVWSADQDDPFLGALLVRVLVAIKPEQLAASLDAYAKRFGEECLARYAPELAPLLAAHAGGAWQGLGPIQAELGGSEPPAPAADSASGRGWRELAPPDPSGLVELGALSGAPTTRTLAYAQTFLRAEGAHAAACVLGSARATRVWLGSRLVYSNATPRRANALEKLLALELEPGWNRLTIELAFEAGAGSEPRAGGFTFHLLTDGVEQASAPR